MSETPASTIFVSKFYEMDPEFDDLVSEGTQLKNGMIVLIEDHMCRADHTQTDNPYEMRRAREASRWCTVSDLQVRRRFVHNDMGYAMEEDTPLISFIGLYADGTKRKRAYSASFAWIVKKDSLSADQSLENEEDF